MLLKRRSLILLVFFTVVGLMAYKTVSTTPLYTATATLQIEPQDPEVVQIRELMASPDSGGGPYDYYETQFALLRSSPLAAKVITELNLAANLAFTYYDPPSLLDRLSSLPFELMDAVLTYVAKPSPPSSPQTDKDTSANKGPTFEYGVPPGLIGHYLSLMTVQPVRKTRLVSVTFTTPDARLSQQLANAHTSAFLRITLETRFELTREAREFLEKKLAELRGKVQGAEEALQRFRQAHGVISVEGNENIVVDRMVDLNKRLTDARAKRIEAESLYRTVENHDPRYLSEVINNNMIQQLKSNLLALEAEQTRLSATFTPAHPRLVELSEQISKTNKRLDREVTTVVHRIEADYSTARAGEEALQAEAERQEQAALNLKAIGVEYTILKQEVDSSRTLYEGVLKRLNETNVSKGVPVSNMQITERADLPTAASYPRRQRNMMLATALGLFLGVGLALFVEYMDQSISTPEDVRKVVAVPTLGVVPHMRTLRRRIYQSVRLPGRSWAHGLPASQSAQERSLSRQLTLAYHPLSIFSESYRIIHTMLQLAQTDQSPQVILLTSANPGEGKTVTTVNLATTLAQSNHTVVVLDADLRKGSCHTLLGQSNQRGLTQILTGNLTLEEGLRDTLVAGLSFVPRGAMVPNPVALLGSPKMREIVETLRGRFEFVLIDCAPAIAVSDAVVLSRLSDGVLMVIRGRKTTVEMARRAVERLEAGRARILGVVLNGIDMRDPAYAGYRRYYASYYGAVKKDAGMEMED
jgi:capsular exopolysaccharide synthesis family protein